MVTGITGTTGLMVVSAEVVVEIGSVVDSIGSTVVDEVTTVDDDDSAV